MEQKTNLEKTKDRMYFARIRQKDVATKAGVTASMVSKVLKGVATSSIVMAAVTELLVAAEQKVA